MHLTATRDGKGGLLRNVQVARLGIQSYKIFLLLEIIHFCSDCIVLLPGIVPSFNHFPHP